MAPRSLALALLLATAATLATAESDTLRVKFDVTSLDGKKGEDGSFTMEAHPDWAPLGFARFKEMVEADFFKGIRCVHPPVRPSISREETGAARGSSLERARSGR